MSSNPCLKGDLTPYVPSAEKPWNERRIHHLYNKLCNGAPINLIKAAKANKPGVIIDYLLQTAKDHPLPGEKRSGVSTIDYTYQWATENTFNSDGTVTYYKFLELVQMWFNGMIREGVRHKLVLFWSNHFVTGAENYGYYPTWVFQYYYALHKNALGNFKTFVEDMGRNPAMLHYLDGRLNTKNAPNENYARELMELFTMGEGNYTEKDVAEVARALTGWYLYSYRNNTSYIEPNVYGQYFFDKNRHDFGNKRVLGRSFTPSTTTDGNPDYKFVHDTIFDVKKNEIARFICTKIYRFYMYQFPPEEIITGLAQVFMQKWDIMEVLKTLFKSEHFFEEENMGVVIKSNIDNIVHFYRSLDLRIDEDYFLYDWQRKTDPKNTANRDAMGAIYNQTANLGQTLFNPINVAGWQGYRSWLSEFVLVNRWRYNRDHIDYYLPYDSTKLKYREFLKVLSDNSRDPDLIVRKVIEYFFTLDIPEEIVQNAIAVFKSGVPSNYFVDGTWNLDLTDVPRQFSNLMKYLITLPEYQLL